MPSRFSVSRRLFLAAIVLVLSAAATFGVYRETLNYGFNYDDYYFIRPYTLDEILASFHGPWDETGIMVKFYRPLAVAFSAARFELFGLNSVAHHAVSLCMFGLAAVMAAGLAWGFTRRPTATLLAPLFFICHPAMPYSLVAWITNQMHLLQILVVLGALLWWNAVRRRSPTWWIPLLLFAVISFLIKEDGIMLLPCILTLHELRRLTSEEDLPHTHWAFAVGSLLLVAGLIWLRSEVLGEIGGYGRPTVEHAWANVSGAVYGVYRLVPADREWQLFASAFATWLPVAALAAWSWISRGARYCLLAGTAIAVLFALPFIFVAKAEQTYMLGFGFTIVLTGAAVGALDLAARTSAPFAARLPVAIVVAGGLVCLALVSRDITRDFEPFGPIVLAHDETIQRWAPVPPELREYAARKREPDARTRISPNPLDEVSMVTYHTHGRDVTPDGVPYMWMAGTHSELYVPAAARAVTIPLRHEVGIFREPARVRIEANGRLTDEFVLTTSEWRFSSAALRQTDAHRRTRMHCLRITIDRAWRPADVIPGSTDGRVLGLQLGTPVVR